MDHQRITFTRKINSLSPFNKNKTVTNNSSPSKRYYNTKTTNSMNTRKYYEIVNNNNENEDYNRLLKEKNTIIQKLQNQINKLVEKSKERNQKIKVQQNIIDSLNDQIRQLKEELITKNLMIKQNQNIENKIFQLQKEYLDENNQSGNSFIYLESIKEYMDKLNNKDEEINKYKKQVKILTMKLKEREKEIINKNNNLKKNNRESGEDDISFLKKGFNDIIGKKAKSFKGKFHLKKNSYSILHKYSRLNDSKESNLYNNKLSYELNEDIEYNYAKLLENYKDLKVKYNYYYKISHNFKLKINSLNEERQKLIKNINVLSVKNNNLNKLLTKYTNNNNMISFTQSKNKQKIENLDKSITIQNKSKINNTVTNSNINNNNILILLDKQNGINQNQIKSGNNMNNSINNKDLYFNESERNQKLKINLIKNKNQTKMNIKKSNDLISDDEKEEENSKNKNINLLTKNDITKRK